jgi:hypothetical protein
MEERTSSMRLDLIQEFISQYARNEAVLPVEPYQLDQAVRSNLDFVVEHMISTFSRQLIRICGRMREYLLFLRDALKTNFCPFVTVGVTTHDIRGSFSLGW